MANREHNGIALFVRDYATGIAFDCTPYLFRDSLRVVRERERDRFEFVVDDMHVKLSNHDGAAKAYFEQITQTSKCFAELYAAYGTTSTREFYGRIEPKDVKYDKLDETVSFDVMSVQRRFFDKANSTPVARKEKLSLPTTPYTLNMTLQDLLRYELWYHKFPEERLFVAVDLGDFSAREIVYASNEKPGNFQNIDDSLNWSEFLNHLSIYYNAEWYIDVDTLLLTLLPRNRRLGTTEIVGDDLLKRDAAPEIGFVDQSQVDYLLAYLVASNPTPSIESTQEIALPALGERPFVVPPISSKYVIVYWVDDEPRFKTDELEWRSTAAEGNYQRPTIRVYRSSVPAVTKREVYRFNNGVPSLGYRLQKIYYDNNADELYVDSQGPYNDTYQSEMPDVEVGGVDSYMRFDERNNAWDEPIYAVGNLFRIPEGVIMDIRPAIAFIDPGETTDAAKVTTYPNIGTAVKNVLRSAGKAEMQRPVDGQTVFEFFNSELDAALFHEQYKEVFLTKRRIFVSMRGTQYKIGDVLKFSKHGLDRYGTLVIKSAEIDFMQQTSKLVLYSQKGMYE